MTGIVIKYFFLGTLISFAYGLKYELFDPKTLFYVSLGGGISWLSYIMLYKYLDFREIHAYFLASLFMSIYAEVMAIRKKKPVTIFLLVAMLPIVPGKMIYDSMTLFAKGQTQEALAIGAQTFAIAGALAMGNLLASTVSMIIRKSKLARTNI